VKKKLQAMLAQKEARQRELITKSEASNDVAELKSIGAELRTLSTEMADLRGMIDAQPDETPAAPAPAAAPETRAAGPVTPAQLLGTFQVGQAAPAAARTQEPADPFGTVEYRTAFMKFAMAGQVTPELRIDAMTAAADISAVIPTTIMNEVIKKLLSYGDIFSRIRKTGIKAGVQVPILSLKPVATWIGETPTSDKQKVQANTSVTFSYFGLECKIATSLVADTVALPGFESTMIDLITEAMIIAIETAIVKGNGAGKMLGIVEDTRVPAGQIITLAAADFIDWSAWKKKVFAKMPVKYKAGAVWLMAGGTFEGYIDGMVDANGQPVGRTNYNITEGPQERFGGKPVIQVEDDIIAAYEDAGVGDVVAILTNLGHYCMNSNMQMTMFRYFDHDTNEWIDKGILIADGKLLDPNGVIIVKKGA
jgi:HK97 family phage major capsid protein